MSSKMKTATIKAVLTGGKATPGGTLGPMLGQKQVPMKQFCDKFNQETSNLNKELRVKIMTYDDKSWDYRVVAEEKSIATLLKEAAKVQKGAGKSGKETISVLDKAKAMAIAEIKMKDLNVNSIEAAFNSVKGSAKSMGIEIEV